MIFSLNSSFTQKVKSKHNIHANVPNVIHIEQYEKKPNQN